MTFCTIIRTNDGIVGVSDTVVLAGTVRSVKSKMVVHSLPRGTCFTLTSGLRSITDKVLHYATPEMSVSPAVRLFEIADLLGRMLRRVHADDAHNLELSRLQFDAHILLGGQLDGDPRPTAYLIYPQGNWIEVGTDTPFLAIGKSSYGLSILKSFVHMSDPIAHALNVATLAFDATAQCTADVSYPMEVAVLGSSSAELNRYRLDHVDVEPLLTHYRRTVSAALASAPTSPFATVPAFRHV